MDNSDDYFHDSFDLDDNDLAVLAAEEAKYAESISQFPTRVPDSLPPAKRQKLSHQQISEDIPDVFLRPDGSYGVAGLARQSEGEWPDPANLLAVEQPTSTPSVQNGMTTDARPSQHRGEIASLSASSRPPERSKSLRRLSEQTDHSTGLALKDNQPRGIRRDLEGELATLKSTVEMLKLENNRVTAALRGAETFRFAKEGEVSILRRKIEKAAQQHAEDTAKLKEAKEVASLERAKIQKDMRQQIEHLRTEYIFKQHEIEASTRKSIWSSKAKRTASGSQMSPVPVPPAMRGWNSSNKTNACLETPSGKRRVTEQQNLTRLQVGAKTRPAAHDLKFPGFENSFLLSSPLKTPSRARQPVVPARKTSGTRTPTRRDRSDVVPDRVKNGSLSPVKLPPLIFQPLADKAFDEFQVDDSIQDFDGDRGFSDGSPRTRPKSVRVESSPNLEHSGLDSAGGLGFSDDMEQDAVAEEGTFDGIDWGEELHYSLFAHTCRVSDGLTFHFLLRADVPNQEYQQSCSGILEALGTKYKFTTLPDLMAAVARRLVSMVHMLWEADRPRHLQALFELLSSIMTYIPSFTAAVLQSGFIYQSATDEPWHMFSDVASKSLSVGNAEVDRHESSTSLVRAMLTFLEAAVWTAPDELQTCFVPLLRSERTFLTLLDNKQPSSIVSHVIRDLVVLASRPSVFQVLFSSQNDEIYKENGKDQLSDSLRFPLLERLSSFLVDAGPLSGLRVDEELFSILNFFTLLVMEIPESRPVLLRSSAFIPCLIHYLTRLSTVVWEDNEDVMKACELAKRSVQNMRQGLCLLHQLVIPTQSDEPGTSDFDFRQKLLHAPHSMFNGLTHMFIVMIGRLSYADPPDWLDVELQAEIERLTEPARDLMDLVIEGPEGDSVWIAYQDAEDQSVTENDDEMEAQLLQAEGHD